MEGIQVALVITAIIEVIILICFFVLCANVAKIKKHLIQKTDFDSKFKFLMNIGEKEKAHEILINRILSNNGIFSKENYFWDAKTKTKMCFTTYGDEFKALGIENPFPEEENKKESKDYVLRTL